MTDRPRVLVTRPAAQAQGLSDLIAETGAQPVCLAAIEILPPADPNALANAAASLEQFDLAVFVSVNAVNTGLAGILSQRDWPGSVLLATIGPASRDAVAALGLHADLVPTRVFSSEGLLALDELQDLQGKRVIIFRGNGGRGILYDTMRSRGAQAEYGEVYRRACPRNGDQLQRLLKAGGN